MSCCSSTTSTTLSCPCPKQWRAAGLGAAVFAWYAMPDVVHSRVARAAIKVALSAGAGALAMQQCPLSLRDVATGNWHRGEAGSSCCGHRGESADTSDDAAEENIGVTPGSREVLGTLRDRETFEAGGTCGCGKGTGSAEGGCCKGQASNKEKCCKESAREDGTCCKDAAGSRCPVLSHLESPQAIAAGAAFAGAVALGESAAYRCGEWLASRGVRYAHTKQAGVFAALAAGAAAAAGSCCIRD
ncbi:hypothetical protein H8R18_07465 [Nanchangia anserum]|uniref:Uncharacterized protein n=1 Tax=Nanchangia anserum TaxID=2692125 RepID=A0A8I0KU65_9ACTO|nr:hypothetical protein [Nanchangia anserum]MBD3689363.1 hypothetical protein [Nanchangia anserum]QOX81569.1 hypothetical protein H8R18_07465 [Nanchangia anserum]